LDDDYDTEGYSASPVARRQGVDSPVACRQRVDSPVARRQGVDSPVARRQRVDSPVARSQRVDSPVALSQRVDSPVARRQKVDSPVARVQRVEEYVARSGLHWSIAEPARTRTQLSNIMNTGAGIGLPSNGIQTIADSYELFITPEILTIVTTKNQQTCQQSNNSLERSASKQ